MAMKDMVHQRIIQKSLHERIVAFNERNVAGGNVDFLYFCTHKHCILNR